MLEHERLCGMADELMQLSPSQNQLPMLLREPNTYQPKVRRCSEEKQFETQEIGNEH